MNIDIRNLPEDFEAAIIKIIAEEETANTAAKAVKLATLHFLHYKKMYHEAREEIKVLKKEAADVLNEIDVFFEVQNNLQKRVLLKNGKRENVSEYNNDLNFKILFNGSN